MDGSCNTVCEFRINELNQLMVPVGSGSDVPMFPRNVRSKKGRDSEDSDLEDDLDDEEVSLGSMDEEDFGEDEGGTFMDPDDEGRERSSGRSAWLPPGLSRFVPPAGPELEDGEDEDVPEGQFGSSSSSLMIRWDLNRKCVFVPAGSGEEAELPAIPQTRKRKSFKEPNFSGPLGLCLFGLCRKFCSIWNHFLFHFLVLPEPQKDKKKKRRKDGGVCASAEEVSFFPAEPGRLCFGLGSDGPFQPAGGAAGNSHSPVFLQFGSLLDENTDCKLDNISMNAMANSDRAGRTRTDWNRTRTGRKTFRSVCA